MRTNRTTSLLAFLLAAGLAGPAAALAAEMVDRIVAVVNDDIILLSELAAFSAPFEERAAQEAPDPVGRALARREVRQKLLDELVGDRLVEDEARMLGLDVSAREVEAEVARIRRENNMSEAEFQRQLRLQGLDERMLRDQLRRQKLRSKVLEVRVQPRVVISDAEIRRYYEENFKNDDEVRVRMISKKIPHAASRAEVNRIELSVVALRDKVRGGADFGVVAEQETEGSNPTQGGEIGWVRRGDVAEEIERVAFALEANEVSDPFVLGAGIHILQVMERRSHPPKPFEEVKDRIRGMLFSRAAEKEYFRWVADLKSKAFVEMRLDGPVPAEDAK